MTGARGGPILVTGMPRTATSWVGKMLEASGALVYVNEPMNPQHPPGRSPGVLRAEVQHAFQYISEHNEPVWLPAFRDTVRLRFHPLAELRRNHRPYDLARTVQYTAGFALGRLRGRRAHRELSGGVFLADASGKGQALVDRELYLPAEWAADPGRRAEAHAPEQMAFLTKPQLTQAMLERALEAGVPAGW